MRPADEAAGITTVPTSTPGAPFAGVDTEEWVDLVERARESGSVHAEDVAHVLRHV